ncbi:MAG: anthranilate synthase component I [Candidatus Methanomethylophilaceae archaeon]
MEIRPSLSEVRMLAKEYKAVPVSMEIAGDMITPVCLLNKVMDVSNHCFILESVERQRERGRYVFIGYNPTLEVTCQNGSMKVRAVDGKNVTLLSEEQTVHPAVKIREILKEHRSPRLTYLPPFSGGLVGYFSYDYMKYSEPSLVLDAKDEEGFKDVDLMLFDKVIVFDNYTQKIILIANASTESVDASYEKARRDLADMAALIRNGTPKKIERPVLKSDIKPLFSEEEYCRMVEIAKEHIYEGDIFQVVLSNRLEAEMDGNLLNTYRALRSLNPSPYMFYFCSDDIELAGASPETLVKMKDGEVRTFPLAGTRPRGKTEASDRRLEEELLSDEKERAEHNMLVDLGRNDIGKVSEFGSVEVERYMTVEKFSHVMHMGSEVKGMVRDGMDVLDVVDAILPAGTLSGAPKLRACEIINELENNKRGIYGGAIGYLDLSGNMDTCIAIRLAFKKNGKVFIRSGAGIVADSVPEREYRECMDKAAAVIKALKISTEDESL